MWWWTILGRRSGCSAASAAWLGNSSAKWEGRGRCRGDNRRGAGVAANNEEATPKKTAGSDAWALDSAPWLGSNITDEDGGSPKYNPLAAVAAPEEAITVGVVAADAPKEKSASGSDKASSFFYYYPLSPDTDPAPLLMAEEEDNLKENMPTSPELGGANNVAPKEKPPSSFLSFLLLVFAGTGNAGGGASNTNPLLVLSPGPVSVNLWELSPSPLDRSAAAPRPFHPSSIFHLKYCVWWSYFNFIGMMITDSIWSTMLRNLTLLLLLFITNYPIITKICQVINYHIFKTIKR